MPVNRASVRALAQRVKKAIWADFGLNIKEVRVGRRPARAGKLCLFAHWDRHGIVDDYVLHYLRRLTDHGYSIRLVSTSARLDPESVKKALTICERVIRRRNTGLDFASWRDAAIRPARLGRYDHLLLANDSVFGPFTDLGPTLDRMEHEPAAIWGLTDSNELAHHLQSYFLCLPQTTLRSGVFRSFWRNITAIYDKQEIIERFEVGISTRLSVHGAIRAAFPLATTLGIARSLGDRFQYADQFARSGDAMNTTLVAWDLLLKDLNFPFLKTDVLKRNPLYSTSLKDWPDLLPREGRSQVGTIIRFLRRAFPDSPALEFVASSS